METVKYSNKASVSFIDLKSNCEENEASTYIVRRNIINSSKTTASQFILLKLLPIKYL